MLAREIHNRSARSGELMVSVDMGPYPKRSSRANCSAMSREPFTDARADRAGKFEVADHGTLFLDEIGNLPPHLQSKLLTAIQGGRIFRVGSNTPVAVDIRLICATNRDLFGMVARGSFAKPALPHQHDPHRPAAPAAAPPRRHPAAGGNVPETLRHEVQQNRSRVSTRRRCAKWTNTPGRVTSASCSIPSKKAVIMSDGRRITPATLLLRPAPAAVQAPAFSTLEEMERGMIGQAMARYAGNLTEVARQLGITRQTLNNKIKRYGL